MFQVQYPPKLSRKIPSGKFILGKRFMVSQPLLWCILMYFNLKNECQQTCSKVSFQIWMFPKIGVPQNGWFIMEKPIKMDDLGFFPLFLVQHPFHENFLVPSLRPYWTPQLESSKFHRSRAINFDNATAWARLRGRFGSPSKGRRGWMIWGF